MIRKIRYRLVYNRNRQINARGEALVQIEMQLNGERRYFSTKVYLRPDQWDGNYAINHPLADEINRFLFNELINAQKLEFDYIQHGKYPSLKMMKTAIVTNISVSAPFGEFVRRVNDASTDRSEQTKAGYESLIRQVEKFCGQITIEDIDLDWINRFVNWSKGQQLSINTIIGRLKSLRAIMNEAVKRKLIKREDDPFLLYKIPSMKARDEFLLYQEVIAISNTEMKTFRERRIRDCFVFACCTGFRFSDLNTLTKNHIVDMEGHKWIIKKPLKTKKTSDVTVKIPIYAIFDGLAVRLIEKYGSVERLCHIGNNAAANRTLKNVLAKSGISSDRHITFHTARHSCATLLLEQGVSITTIQKILGHTKLSTTQIYVKLLTSTIQHDVERAFSDSV